MISSPDSEVAKFVVLLNSVENVEEDEQRASLQDSTPHSNRPSAVLRHQLALRPEAKIDNNLAEHIASAMAKRNR
jgi:hypothetical protein